MDSAVLRENPVLLESSFREELGTFFALGPETIQQIIEICVRCEQASELGDATTWTAIAEASGEALDDVVKWIQPIRYIGAISAIDETPLGDVIEALDEAGILGTESNAEKRASLAEACVPIASLFEKVKQAALPDIPARRLKSFKTRCNIGTEFMEEFNPQIDTVDTYRARIKRLKSYTTMHVALAGGPEDEIDLVIALDGQALDQMIAHLELARVQQRAVDGELDRRGRATEAEDEAEK